MEAVAGEQGTAESDRDIAALFVLPAAGTAAQQSFTHNVGSTVGSVKLHSARTQILPGCHDLAAWRQA